MRSAAEAQAFDALSGMKLRIFQWVLARARRRVADRENLRFLRTRIFGRIRDLFIALGGHMHEVGALSSPRDIFWLTTDEAFGWVRGTTVTTDLKGLVSLRSREYQTWQEAPEPADRFRTWGPVWANNLFLGKPVVPQGDGLSGLPACPGLVEGRVARVIDPNDAGDVDGAIMVAYRTDPGWVPLFPRISALVVERGSLLSHSAVVARGWASPPWSPSAASWMPSRAETGSGSTRSRSTIEILEKAGVSGTEATREALGDASLTPNPGRIRVCSRRDFRWGRTMTS